MKNKTVKRVKFSAWAVIDDVLAKHHGACLMFNPQLEQFSLAIFSHEDFAANYVNHFKGKLKLRVVPISFSYQIKAPRGKRT